MKTDSDEASSPPPVIWIRKIEIWNEDDSNLKSVNGPCLSTALNYVAKKLGHCQMRAIMNYFKKRIIATVN